MAYRCSGCGALGTRITKCPACQARRTRTPLRRFVLSFAQDGQRQGPKQLGRFETLEAAQAVAQPQAPLSWRGPGLDFDGWSARLSAGTFLIRQETEADVALIGLIPKVKPVARGRAAVRRLRRDAASGS